MKGKIARWGNSYAIRIPSAYAENMGLAEGTAVDIETKKDTLVVRKSDASLEELVAGITSENRHDEVDWGAPVGKEAW